MALTAGNAQMAAPTSPTPNYPASPATTFSTSEEIRFSYRVRDFTTPLLLDGAPKPGNSFDTPVNNLRLRAHAMMNADYEAWLTTWDEAARLRFATEAPNRIAEQKRQWHALFSVSKMVIFRYIETREYVILTYKMLDNSGNNIGQFELPTVFRRVGEQWLGTQELSSDLLLLESPWLSNRESVQKVIR